MSRSVASRVLGALAIVVSCATAPATAYAQPSAPTPRRLVSVVVSGSNDDARVLSITIRELLARQQLTMIDRVEASSRDGLLASVAIDVDAVDGARVVVRSANGAILLDRSVHDANPAIQREQIAHAVRGAAEAALLADEDRAPAQPALPSDAEAPSSPTPPREPEPQPPKPPPESPRELTANRNASGTTPAPSPLAVDVATVLGGGPVASSVGPVMRVGGFAALADRRGPRPAIALGALYAFPFESGGGALTSRAKLVSVRAMAAIELLRGSWLALDVGAGGGFDALEVEPSSTVLPASALRDDTTKVDPIVSFGTTARFALASDVTLTVSAVSDVDPVERKYVFHDRGRRSTVFAPWTVRPMLLVGLSFAAFGDVEFDQRRPKPEIQTASLRQSSKLPTRPR